MKDLIIIVPGVEQFRLKFKTKGTEKLRHTRNRIENKITLIKCSYLRLSIA